ncbi:MAG: cupin domain-containing protein [Acidimicrobiia bacterium]
MRYHRISNDGDGQTRFDDGEIAFASAEFAPPAPPLDVSPAMPAREVMFIRFAAGWSDAAHPSPARQWMFVLSGRGETTAGGETRPWGPGDVFLLEDTSPPGHGTTILEDAVLAVVRG